MKRVTAYSMLCRAGGLSDCLSDIEPTDRSHTTAPWVANTYLRRATLFALASLFGFVLAGCARGLDAKPDTVSQEKYKTQIAKDFESLSDDKKEAFDFAVQNLTFDSLKSSYAGKTYRQIAGAELDKMVTDSQEQMKKADGELKAVVQDLLKIQATTDKPRIENDFFGPQFKFDVLVNNSSSRDVSKIVWTASLYLDNQEAPVAKADIYTLYESRGGLKAGQSASEVIQVGLFRPEQEWVNLTSINAKNRRVALELADVYDFSNQSYVTPLQREIDALKKVPGLVEQAKQALIAKDAPTAKTTQSTTQQVNRTTCTNQCVNGNCVRTFPDGRQEQWQAPRTFDPMSQNWGWDTTTNACGI